MEEVKNTQQPAGTVPGSQPAVGAPSPVRQPQAAQAPASTQAAQPQPPQGRPCPKDCRKCPMAQQICCASMLSFRAFDVMNVVIQRLDAQQHTIAELSERLNAIQSSEAELASPVPFQGDLFLAES
ncbi:MAG: hypothetical protein IJ615_10670 [Bacteroidaceae bacterium]|nr:hypothetical protein [Bacteroidaceae bacterium]